MKFDLVIGNPPYNRNLHLKILEEVISLAQETIWLSPIRWIQDPTASFKKNSDYYKYTSIIEKMTSLEVIDTTTASKSFNIGLLQPLGIYLLGKGGYKVEHSEMLLKVYTKILEENNLAKLDVVLYSDDLQNYVCLNKMAPSMKYGKPFFDTLKNFGAFVDGKDYKSIKEGCKQATRGSVYNTECISFNTKQEAINCYDSFSTKFAKYITMSTVVDIHVHCKFLPFMGDYTQPWTDERFYKYFELTDEEIEEIETTMAPYQ